MADKARVWTDLVTNLLDKKSVYGQTVYVTRGDEASPRWLIGKHSVLKEVLPRLRGKGADGLDLASHMLYGRREIDVPPASETRTKSYKDKIDPDKPAPMGPAEYMGILKRNKGEGLALPEVAQADWVKTQRRRQREMFPAAELFFANATLESHHIFEKFLVKKLGELDGDVTIADAPCVAASKEIHGRYFTREIALVRADINSFDEAREVYAILYKAPIFGDLLKISSKVINEVERIETTSTS